MPAALIRFARKEGTTLLAAAITAAAVVLLFRSVVLPSTINTLHAMRQSRALQHELRIADSLSTVIRTVAARTAQLKDRCLNAASTDTHMSIDAAGACDRLVHIADGAAIRFVRLMPDPARADGALSCEFNEPFAQALAFFSALERDPQLIVDNCVIQSTPAGSLQVRCVIRYAGRGYN